MKRILISLMLAILTNLTYGQESGPLKFLGIPIDGSKEQMITKLRAKGFTYSPHRDVLSGQFNGEDVAVSILTNHNIVYRVYVRFPSTSSEYSIKNKYNRLLSQFQDNSKYMNFSLSSEIPADEDISYEMLVNDKHYEAAFYYFDSGRDMKVFASELYDGLAGLLPDAMIQKMKDLALNLDGLSPDEIMALSSQIMEETGFDPSQMGEDWGYKFIATLFSTMVSLADGNVWFTIHQSGAQYNIGLYYDNVHNQAHGEDL